MAVRVLKLPESGPKRKLLDATERLIVEKGFDLVSVRDITGAVKANVAAVNYHFGSREELMDLVALRVMEPLNEERTKALETAERQRVEKTASVEDIVAAYVRPLFTTATRLGMEVPFFLKLAGRVLVLSDAEIFPPLSSERTALTHRYIEVISGAFPKSRSAEIGLAWRFFEAGLGQSLLNLRENQDPTEQSNHWIAFGSRALGISKEAPQPKKDTSQGMLFDF